MLPLYLLLTWQPLSSHFPLRKLRDFHFYIIIITPLLDIYRTWGLLCFTCISTRRRKKKTSGLWCYPVLVWRRSARDGCGVLWCGTQAGAGQSPHLCTRCSLRGGRRRRNTTGVRWGETTVKIQMMESGMSVNSVEMWRRAHWMWVRVCEVCWPQRHGSKGTQPEQITMQFTLSILIPCKIFSVTQFILNPITSLRYLRLNKPKDWIL